MGPLHGATQYSYVLIIHDAHSGMIWVQGLAHKGAASQEAAWWLSKIHVAKNQRPSEVTLDHGIKEIQVDQGELWSATFCELCSLMGMKISTSPTQQHTDNAFAEWAIQTIQKIAWSLIYDSGMDEQWWPHAILQAAFIHNRLAVQPCTLQGTYLGFSDKPCVVKGHKVWLPELDHVVVAKDIQFLELEQLGVDPHPFHRCVLAGDHELLHSYTWFPQDEVTDETEADDVTHSLLPMYSCQCTIDSNSSPSDVSSFSHEWD
ncbi:hypothetical protein NDA10_006404 [Ustilago hordei]|uniref:Conserved uncharacterized protein n=1 Tax=Ustilago hordei TaxID=120017 RepID=I2FZ42_USTHO|nr:uncharacterized protein UHO2_06778 [Ustilago hordei]KAJ1036884.1 hypothetical protein NDA10_006404 [Ustilago hordei]CCF52185.1 conserved uncharacterized protein [Ustilago hordei]SYW83564.1 uncharacterized protein UHO2_06778 [Ustilago hordei]